MSHWTLISSGLTVVYRNGDTVMKFLRYPTYHHDTPEGEWLRWNGQPYPDDSVGVIPEGDRKHFAKCFGYVEGLLFQEYVPNVDGYCRDIDEVMMLAARLHIPDPVSNHGHKGGHPVFFD